MASTVVCECTCPSGVPSNWSVTVSGVTNATCTRCSQLNGTYVLFYNQHCMWGLQFATNPICPNAYNQVILSVSGSSTGTNLKVLFIPPAMTAPTYELDDICDCWGPFTVPLVQGDTACNWPQTITVKAVVPPITDPNLSTCVAVKGCSVGFLGKSLRFPFLGASTSGVPLPKMIASFSG